MNRSARLLLSGLLCALCLAAASVAASTWEGSAVMGGLEDFPSDDLFGACNSFPVNSSVEVENLDNGKKITVVISQTIENPAVFMALSPKAASSLGMKRGTAARVRVVAAPAASAAAPRPGLAPGSSADPDYNPSVLAYAKPSSEKEGGASGSELSGLLGGSAAKGSESSADIETVAAPEEEAPLEASPTAIAMAAPALAEPAETEAQAAAQEETAPQAASLEEKAAEAAPAEATPAPETEAAPAKATPEPETGATTAEAGPEAVEAAESPAPEAATELAAAEPAVAEPEPAETAETVESAALAPAAEAAAPAAEPEAIAAGGVEAPPEAPAEAAPELESASVAAPAEAAPALAEAEPSAEEKEADVVLSLEPTAERPPLAEKGPAAQAGAEPEAIAAYGGAAAAPSALALEPAQPQPSPAAMAAPASKTGRPAQDPAGVPRIEVLAKGSYYVQIGVFATDDALTAAVSALGAKRYPIAYERVESMASAAQYRLFVGPLRRDESGLMLKKIKAMGYRDAFLKKGN